MMMKKKFKKEFTHSVRLTERVYMQGNSQRIERILCADNGDIICSEDYPAAYNKGELANLVSYINELSHPTFDGGVCGGKAGQCSRDPLDAIDVFFKTRFRLQFLKLKNRLVKLLNKNGFFKRKASLP